MTVMLEEGSTRLATGRGQILAMARATFLSDHGRPPDQETARADVRYVGQSHELTVELGYDWQRLRSEFEDLHRSRFGFILPAEPIEVVNVRAEVTAPAPVIWDDIPALPGGRGGGESGSPVVPRHSLAPGDRLVGPVAVIEADSAVWLEHDDVLTVHEDGTLEIEW
jgi:N-methylhydantoinase A/oxoprolinase/acetone carboxylase beta subunit